MSVQPRLPAGTVTFLFTDIEGSTRLLKELGDDYADALAEHRRVLRAAFARHGGVEVDTQGDSFFVAFARASDALAAAADGRVALSDGPIRVRMGLHTGEPLLVDDDYVGIDVHRAARIAAAGHGGQILVSQSTRELARAEGLRDLGEHRLKDLTAAERIHQLGEGDFPPLKSLNQTNLPPQPTPLVGRRRELREVIDALRVSRLLTLTGAGGSGKTRLALQAAAELVEEFLDGVWFVSLASLRDPNLVEPTIAHVLGARDDLEEFFQGKKLLLLLDNLEQLLPEIAPWIAQLDVPVLATSRERLHIRGEQEYPVPTLPVDDAIVLFTQRARQLNPTFEPDEYVTEIARRLDGLPLALELAAARAKVLKPRDILRRLGRSLELLTAGTHDAPERQRTLRATIEWSFALLAEPEQRVFGRLGVFAGSFDVEAAWEIAGADLDTLQSLLDKSLLRNTEELRFFLLETIREYALERLDSSREAETLQQRHAMHYVALAEQGQRALRGPDSLLWLDRLGHDHQNLRAALAWSLARTEQDVTLRLVGALWLFWILRGHVREGRRWAADAVASSSDLRTPTRARALFGASEMARAQGDYRAAVELKETALPLFRDLGEDGSVASVLSDLGAIAAQAGEYERAGTLHEEALSTRRALGDAFGIAHALMGLGRLARSKGRYAEAAKIFEECADSFREVGSSVDLASALHELGLTYCSVGDTDRAAEALHRALELAREMQDIPGTMWSLQSLAGMALARDDAAGAARLLGIVDRLQEETGIAMLDDMERERTLAAARACLGDEMFTTSFSEGREVSVEEALAVAGREIR
jgi:predicted ATPase/class 3 adenylate cyclase